MKAAITTFFDHSNYGAVLQAYALQRKIESFGDNACHISFNCMNGDSSDEHRDDESLWLKKMRFHTNKRNENFKSFRDRYLHICQFSEKLVADTDVFITGSDQVFNTALPGWTDRFLLSFASCKRKTAYAASFGDKMRDEKLFMEGLKSFDSISMREESAVQIVRDLTGKMPSRVIDPVFLLGREDWSSIADTSGFQAENPYLLFVMVQNNMALFKGVSEYAESKGLDLKMVTMSFFPPAGFEPWSGVLVEDYLKLIKNADLVVTSSFHALSFSIIFGREFKTLALTGDLSDRNCRITELLEMLGLKMEDNGRNGWNRLSEEKKFSENWLKDEILRH